MPSTKPKTERTPTGRPEYVVQLTLAGERRHYRLEVVDLDHLADVLEVEVRSVNPNQHVGVRLDVDGTVYARVGWTESKAVGTWSPA